MEDYFAEKSSIAGPTEPLGANSGWGIGRFATN